VKPALGYRFDFEDRSIASTMGFISGRASLAFCVREGT
jgi:hypothetical protein